MKRKKRFAALIVILLLAALTPPFLYWQNNSLTVSRYDYVSGEVPPGLDGYRIVQLSDLQDKCFGVDQTPLLERTAALEPDLIVLTGDMVDYNKFTMEPTLALMRGVVEIAPCYYVTGNHESAFDTVKLREILTAIANCGVTVLEDQYVWIEKDGGRFCLFGLADDHVLRWNWQKYLPEEDCLCLMLAHRPERLDRYAEADVDLVFSGHAHGGQVRLPFLGGLYAPGQGWFPKLYEGMHERNGTTMLISRGLGNSTFPIRLFNRPEIVELTLRRPEK